MSMERLDYRHLQLDINAINIITIVKLLHNATIVPLVKPFFINALADPLTIRSNG